MSNEHYVRIQSKRVDMVNLKPAKYQPILPKHHLTELLHKSVPNVSTVNNIKTILHQTFCHHRDVAESPVSMRCHKRCMCVQTFLRFVGMFHRSPAGRRFHCLSNSDAMSYSLQAHCKPRRVSLSLVLPKALREIHIWHWLEFFFIFPPSGAEKPVSRCVALCLFSTLF